MSRYRKSWTEVIEEVYLGEALKPIDKSVVDAFYYKKEKEGKVVSTDGDTLTKMGIGGQQIAKWVGRKIKITAVSDVKSTESIIKYIRKSIPSGILEEVDIDEKFAGWIAFYNKEKLEIKPKKGEIDSLNDAKQAAIKHFKVPKSKQGLLAIEPAHEEVEEGVTGPTRMEIQKFFDKEKGTLRARLNKTASHFNIRDVVVNSKGTVVGYQMEEVELSEKEAAYPSTIENLKKIVKDKQNQVFAFKDGGSIRVDLFSASAVVQVYDALKPATKKKFEEMIKTKAGFVKTVDFAFSMAKK